ncbi:hypothetical protein [Rhodococcus chondri]|uniref:Uncharacterized protein n=1 Tax=Rhodococcus chondri TaxID=3065941 RepID=A0ABU7JNP0_9NOCA|nr:hypothetical protein [Rhodococcus sp. CC-R104]MEE2031651.1 hypothetical protein [Rhodococcus sp. CC-R104]
MLRCHIAHVLWGGLLMVAALVVLLSFLGRAPHRIAVLVGGIGFGLFLDEVGKFVTKTNDYFYRPSVAIMYVVVVLVLVANRAVHAARRPTPEENVANAAATVVEGLVHGLTPTSRDQAMAQLEAAPRTGPIMQWSTGSRAWSGSAVSSLPRRRSRTCQSSFVCATRSAESAAAGWRLCCSLSSRQACSSMLR